MLNHNYHYQYYYYIFHYFIDYCFIRFNNKIHSQPKNLNVVILLFLLCIYTSINFLCFSHHLLALQNTIDIFSGDDGENSLTLLCYTFKTEVSSYKLAFIYF